MNKARWGATVNIDMAMDVACKLWCFVVLPYTGIMIDRGVFNQDNSIADRAIALLLCVVWVYMAWRVLVVKFPVPEKQEPSPVVYSTISDVSTYPALVNGAGYVYLIRELSEGHFKIGRTRDPNDRLTTFNVKLPFKIEYICLLPAQDMFYAEGQLHKMFASKRIKGSEWFRLTSSDVEYIKSLAQGE